MKYKKLLTTMFFFIFLLSAVNFAFSYSSVDIFSNYNVIFKISSNNSILVTKQITIKNTYNVGIVPGEIIFKIANGNDDSLTNINITNLRAYDRFGNKINTRLRKSGNYSVIILDVFYPLLPGFQYTFNVSYTMKFYPKGIFFKSLTIPLRDTTVPIDKGTFEVIIPKHYHFTYLGDINNKPTLNKNIAIWKINNKEPKVISFEYSYIPLRIGHVKGSYIFWITLNILLFLFLIYEVRKEFKRKKEN